MSAAEPISAIERANNQVAPSTEYKSCIKFSLILSTIARTAELSTFLYHLDRQTFRNFELIVVDQNSDGRLKEVLAPYLGKFDINHLKSSRGISRSRNRGMNHASGNVIAFPDDDCWYEYDVLKQVADLLREHPDWDAVTGKCTSAGNTFSFLDNKSGFINSVNVWRRAVSVTLFARRSLIARVGEFDEQLGAGSGSGCDSGEETDYLLRALRHGLNIYYDPTITINHPDQLRTEGLAEVEKTFGYARGMGAVLKKHKYPLWFVIYVLLRPFAGSLISAFRLDRARALHYYYAMRGRLAGWLG